MTSLQASVSASDNHFFIAYIHHTIIVLVVCIVFRAFSPHHLSWSFLFCRCRHLPSERATTTYLTCSYSRNLTHVSSFPSHIKNRHPSIIIPGKCLM